MSTHHNGARRRGMAAKRARMSTVARRYVTSLAFGISIGAYAGNGQRWEIIGAVAALYVRMFI